MTDQQNKFTNNSLSRIPENSSEEQASQILGYGIGDVVMLGNSVTSDLSSGGTSAGNTPNSTNSPGQADSGSDMANINVDYSSGNSASNPRDSHQASMANAPEDQQFLVSRFDASKGLFWAYKLNSDGTHENIEVPLASDENYQVVSKGKNS